MSAKFNFGSVIIIGATSLKLFKFFTFNNLVFSLYFCSFYFCCSFQQRSSSGFSPVSMRLRPKRTCSGVESFGGFHIKRFIDLFLFYRGTLT